MNPFLYNYNVEDQKSTFATAVNHNMATNTTDSITTAEEKFPRNHEGLLSATAPSFSRAAESELIGIPSHQEARAVDTASSTVDVDEILYNIRMNSSDVHVDNLEQNANNYYFGNSRPESVASSNIWSDTASTGTRNNEMMDTFDFLVKSLSSANNYVSMLTREQLSVLRSIRPSLLYEFLQEVAKVRSDKRLRRALPNECAFCKNNGENEECYSSHALKDWRGRVLCPVLRAFRCPRCGATGDRAHTIKYCPENGETGSDRSGIMGSRRRLPPSSALVVGAATNRTSYGPITPTTPAPSPIPSISHSSCWAAFTLK